MKIGFIGGGNMGRAMIEASIKAFGIENIIVYAKSKNDSLKAEFDIQIATDEATLAKVSDIIILATKPSCYDKILELIKSSIKDQIIITIAPNFSLEMSERLLGKNTKIARAMPNTPASIKQGVSAICCNKNLNQNECKKVNEIFASFGLVFELEESKFAAFTAIAGSLPAYVFMFIEAVADGGVLNGISRKMAYDIIAASVAGSANLMLKSSKNPSVLKDEICSPSGTTIEAVKELENGGFRAALINAVDACVKKASIKQ